MNFKKEHKTPYIPNTGNAFKNNTLTNDSEYHSLDDFDNPEAWKMKEIDMLDGMGFSVGGDTHMELIVPGDMDLNRYTIAKHKNLGHELKINERKHYFKSFDRMIEAIDMFGAMDVD